MKKFRPFILMTVFCAVMYIILQLILTPIYTVVLSDITLAMSILPTVIHTLLSLLEIFTFALCYSLVIYTMLVRGAKTAVALCGIYVAASVIRRMGALSVSFFMYGIIDKRDIINVLIPVIIETAQIFSVLLISYLVLKNKKTASRSGSLNVEFTKIFSKENPLMSSALASGILLSVVNIAMRIYSDIGYGAPVGTAEVLVMVAYYTWDICTCVLFYAAAWFIISKLLSVFGSKNQESIF